MDAITRGFGLARIPFDQKSMKVRLVKQLKFSHAPRGIGDDRREQVPKVQDERTKEILRELAQLHPEDPRADIWAKV